MRLYFIVLSLLALSHFVGRFSRRPLLPVSKASSMEGVDLQASVIAALRIELIITIIIIMPVY